MKRVIAFLLAFLLPATIMTGCTSTVDTQQGNTEIAAALNEKISIVCTIFPQYDWVRQILGDKAESFELTLLMDNRLDLHNYQPSVDDIVRISTSDLFIYVGGESDMWVEGALRQAANTNMVVISLIDVLGKDIKIEEIIEGMEHDHPHDDDDGHAHDGDDDHAHDGDDGHAHDDDDDHAHDDGHDHSHDHSNENDDDNGHAHGDDNGHTDDDDVHDDTHAYNNEDNHDHAHEGEYDEHVWLSLKHAQTFCAVIADAISTLDADNAAAYHQNLIMYIQKLSDLDARYQAAVEAAPVRTLLFGDRFPFRYLVDDYGIDYYAAFPGCSAETEASFETIVFLARKTDELNLNSIMVTESADQSIARTIVNNTGNRNRQIHVLDSMQSVTSSDVRSGAAYLSIMENNLNVLIEALT